MAIIKTVSKPAIKPIVKPTITKTSPSASKGASKGSWGKGWSNGGGKGWSNGGGGQLQLLAQLLGGGGSFGSGGGSWGGKGGSWGGKGGFKIDKSGGELGEFIGTIKSFNWKTNYGFIECPELAEYGDVFLHGDMKKGYQQGQTVKFQCVVNKEGKPVAINLSSGLKDTPAGSSSGRSWSGPGGFKIDKSGGELGEFVGKIKSFNWKTNYGFIECPELAEHGDVFLHGDMKKGYQQGQTVKFDGVLNKDGKPVAINLKSGLK